MESYDIRYKKALQAEHAKLFDANNQLKSEFREDLNKCPVCSTSSYKVYCEKDSFIHKKCTKCSLVYLDPKLSREATLAFYNSPVNEIYNEQKFHFESSGEPSLDDQHNFKNLDLIKKLVPEARGKKLLEIGAAKGIFLAKAASQGFEVHGVELNEKLIGNLKKITDKIYTEDVISLDLPENYFDVIYHRDVMEHIDQPVAFLKKLYRILKPGGILMIDTHNIQSLVNQATKEFHTVVFAFEHPLHWSPASLLFACEQAGFQNKKLYMDHEYQTLRDILDYYAHPSFTYIYPHKKSKYFEFFSWKIRKYYKKLKFISKLDQRLSLFISKLFRKGAKMQLVVTK